mgnify:CR=1 FL=1
MDPNETLKQLAFAVLAEDAEAAVELWKALKNWMARGGFEPAWTAMTRSQFFREFNPKTGRLDR